MTEFKDDFISMLHDLLGDEAFNLIDALNQPPVVSVRLNKRKPGAEFEEATSVPWCRSGLYLKDRPEFILDPLLHAGAYYVQDASSMIYETVISILLSKFGKEKPINSNIKVLDLCAAPGGKTTAMINSLPDSAWVVANEISPKRVGALKENLAKWRFPNVVVTNRDSSFYGLQGEFFDIVAVDAPCSGEGMMRKEEIARTQWSPQLVTQCATLQKEILDNAINALKPGGFLIYSTCTFNRKENEENAEYLANEKGLEAIDMEFPEEWGIQTGIRTELPVYRFMPHKTKGEGLFLAVFQKRGTWEPDFKEGNRFQKNKENLIIEDPTAPEVNVDKAKALAYLRRESITLSEDAPRGMITICYKGLPLGPAKNIGSRVNNLYPKNWRILKR